MQLNLPPEVFSEIKHHKWVNPCLRVVPMGWSWAMWFAQRVLEQQVLEATTLDADRLLADHEPVPDISCGTPVVLAYADNLNVAGIDREKVQHVKDLTVARLRSKGFSVHEEVDATTDVISLGYRVFGKAGIVCGSERKIRLIRQTAAWLETRPQVRGKDIEVFLGHLIQIMLLHRGFLSILRNLYDFSRECYGTRTRLWPSAAKEAKWIKSLLPLCYADLRLVWDTEVTASDASLSGYAVAATSWAEQDVVTVGSQSERCRYKIRQPYIPPRERALRQTAASVLEDVSTVKPIGDDYLEDTFELNTNFQEVPYPLLRPENWGLCFASRFTVQERIGVLEARASVAAIRHKMRAIGKFRKRHLNLEDNLGLVLGEDKGRAKSFPLLLACRRHLAIAVATASRISHRWHPSEFNNADEGSRLWEPPEVTGRPRHAASLVKGPGRPAAYSSQLCRSEAGPRPEPEDAIHDQAIGILGRRAFCSASTGGADLLGGGLSEGRDVDGLHGAGELLPELGGRQQRVTGELHRSRHGHGQLHELPLLRGRRAESGTKALRSLEGRLPCLRGEGLPQASEGPSCIEGVGESNASQNPDAASLHHHGADHGLLVVPRGARGRSSRVPHVHRLPSAIGGTGNAGRMPGAAGASDVHHLGHQPSRGRVPGQEQGRRHERKHTSGQSRDAGPWRCVGRASKQRPFGETLQDAVSRTCPEISSSSGGTGLGASVRALSVAARRAQSRQALQDEIVGGSKTKGALGLGYQRAAVRGSCQASAGGSVSNGGPAPPGDKGCRCHGLSHQVGWHNAGAPPGLTACNRKQLLQLFDPTRGDGISWQELGGSCAWAPCRSAGDVEVALEAISRGEFGAVTGWMPSAKQLREDTGAAREIAATVGQRRAHIVGMLLAVAQACHQARVPLCVIAPRNSHCFLHPCWHLVCRYLPYSSAPHMCQYGAQSRSPLVVLSSIPLPASLGKRCLCYHGRCNRSGKRHLCGAHALVGMTRGFQDLFISNLWMWTRGSTVTASGYG